MKNVPQNAVVNFFISQDGVVQSPFFFGWFAQQVIQILKAELKVKRKGLPKAGPRPMNRHKRYLALAKILKKFKLKDFAEAFDVSYGVVRLWNREQIVGEKAQEFVNEFANSYIQELKRRYFPPELDLEKQNPKNFMKSVSKANDLPREAKNYDSHIQLMILTLIEEETEKAPEEEVFLWKFIGLTFIDLLQERDIYNPPKDKKLREHFIQTTQMDGKLLHQLTEGLFSNLKDMIEGGNKKKALKITEYLEDHMLNRIKANTDLRIGIINKGKRRDANTQSGKETSSK